MSACQLLKNNEAFDEVDPNLLVHINFDDQLDEKETHVHALNRRPTSSRSCGRLGMLVIVILTLLTLASIITALILDHVRDLDGLDHVEDDVVVDEGAAEWPKASEVWSERLRERRDRLRADFKRRFPRHHPDQLGRRRRQDLREKSTNEEKFEQEVANSSSKVREVLKMADANGDGEAYAWELYEWMTFLEKMVYRHLVKQQWYKDLGRNDTKDVISWADYRSLVSPSGIRTSSDRRRLNRDQRRWVFADSNNDWMLTWDEYHVFLFPQLASEADTEVLGPEAFEDLDTNNDQRVSRNEFVDIHQPPHREQAEKHFQSTLDENGDGWLSLPELSAWLKPSGFVSAMSETALLIDQLDLDGDLSLDESEILVDDMKTNLFLSSQVTFFGKLYQLEGLREEAFKHY